MLLRVGVLLRPYGLHGGLFMSVTTDLPDVRFALSATLFCSRQLTDASDTCSVLTVRALQKKVGAVTARNRWVIFFEEVRDRTLASTLSGSLLLAEPIEDSRDSELWYDSHLVGMKVTLECRKELGRVVGVEHLPMQDLLVVETKAGSVLLPFVKSIVTSVSDGEIIVNPPGGMFVSQVDSASQ